MTSAPSSANASTMAAPMPRLPPVTRATLLRSRPVMGLPVVVGHPGEHAPGYPAANEVAEAAINNQQQRDQRHAAGLAHELREDQDASEPAVDADIFAGNHGRPCQAERQQHA